MFDPPDPLVERFIYGDSHEVSDPFAGPDGMLAITDYAPDPEGEPPLMWVPRYGTITSADPVIIVPAGARPEYWIVAIRPVASGVDPLTVIVWVYNGREAAGAPVEIIAGKKARIPAVGATDAITLRLQTGASATYNVAAIRGYSNADFG